ERGVDGAGRGERSEILSGNPLRAAMLQRLRCFMVGADEDVRERLVVAEDDIEAWLQLLDKVGFEEQRLGFARRHHELHRAGERDHPRDALRVPAKLAIAADTR